MKHWLSYISAMAAACVAGYVSSEYLSGMPGEQVRAVAAVVGITAAAWAVVAIGALVVVVTWYILWPTRLRIERVCARTKQYKMHTVQAVVLTLLAGVALDVVVMLAGVDTVRYAVVACSSILGMACVMVARSAWLASEVFE